MSTRWVVWKNEWDRHSKGGGVHPHPTPTLKSTLRWITY